MSTELKVVGIGEDAGIILPRAILQHLGLKEGDSLTLTQTPEGILLTTAEDEFTRQMRLAEQIMHEDRDVLHLLAQ